MLVSTQLKMHLFLFFVNVYLINVCLCHLDIKINYYLRIFRRKTHNYEAHHIINP